MIQRERLVRTFCELVTIDSPSGQEEEVARRLVRELESLGLEVERDDYGNVIAREPDGGPNPLLLSAHMDTVEPGRGIRPEVQGDRIVSDGSTILGGDCKAGVAAILEAIRSVLEDGLGHRPFEVAFTREEEVGLVGARNLDFSRITAREAIVFDGEGPPNTITSASPTYVAFDVEVTGRAAHAGVEPEKGLSALRIAAQLVERLPQGRLDAETTFNIGTLQAGTVRNAVPEKATLQGEFRSTDPETLEALGLQVRRAVEDLRRANPEAIIELKVETQFEAYRLTEDDAMARKVKAALDRLGMAPVLKASGGGTDANIFRRHGIAAVVVGMAVTGMHTVRESVSVPDLVDAARLCEALLKG